MQYKIMPEACRICLRKCRSCRSIFEPYSKEDLPPCEKLKLVSGVNVTQSDEDFTTLPKLICRSCEISLNMAFDFRNQARKSDQIVHIYCNRLNKDNIIVELDTGRKFKLSKELTLKVVRNNKQPTSQSPMATDDDMILSDREEHFDESKVNVDINKLHVASGTKNCQVKNEPLMKEEDFIEDDHDEETLDLSTEDHLSISDNDYCSIPMVDEDDSKEEEEKEEIASAQLYNGAEIAKQLEASEKYEVVSWKQEGDNDAVPVFKLRLKGVDTKPLTNDFICEVCGNTYRQRHKLMEHMRRHSDEKSYACEICTKRFAVAEGLRRHVLTHGAQKPFKCNYCTRSFFNPSARKAHEIVHSGAKPYICNICKRAFAYTCSLRKHMLIHENKKLYRCDYCDKEFRLQHHLKQHEETQIHNDAMLQHIVSKENSTLLKDEVRST